MTHQEPAPQPQLKVSSKLFSDVLNSLVELHGDKTMEQHDFNELATILWSIEDHYCGLESLPISSGK